MSPRYNRIDRVVDESDKEQLTTSSEFSKDLGLDSLDTVEVVMAIEEASQLDEFRGRSDGLQEFGIEIPDKEADGIHSGMCVEMA
jgi:NADH dehydrogenase (ubiquinone) 1 alpha/beta subcomplex 1